MSEVWQRWDAMEARLSAPLSERMLDLARIGRGMRVLDLATGRGEPAIRAAHRVGATGTVVGIDLSESMLAMARARADAEGVTNLELRVGDAASFELPDARFDAVLARWGLMYMTSPVVALERARRAMTSDARLVVAVWTEPLEYFTLPRRLLAKYRSIPSVDASAPGVLHYADEARLRADCERAGLRVEHVEDLEVPVLETDTTEGLVAWTRAFAVARLIDDLPADAQRAWEADLVATVEKRNGFYRLGGVTRIIVALEDETRARARA